MTAAAVPADGYQFLLDTLAARGLSTEPRSLNKSVGTCPNHTIGTTLTVERRRGGVVTVSCRLGCTEPEILAKLGLAWTGPDAADTGGGRLGSVLTRAELATLPRVSPLVAGVLSCPSAAVLVGAYGLGKTVLAHGLGLCVATGLPWLGRAVVQRRVLFVVGEGAYGLDERIGAWEQAWNGGEAVTEDQVTFLIKPTSLRDADTWTEISAFAVEGNYGLVILDTFSSLAPDADETKDAAAIMRRVSDLSSALSGTVLLVHHPGWSDAGRTRGGYQFEANADEVLVMTAPAEGSSLICLTRKKVKDGASGGSLWINRKVAFGSVIFEHARPDDAAVPLRARLLTVLGNYGEQGATGPQLKAELGVADAGQSGFYKSLRGLVESKEIREDGPRSRQRYFLAAALDPVASILADVAAKPW